MKIKILLVIILLLPFYLSAQENYLVPIRPGNEPIAPAFGTTVPENKNMVSRFKCSYKGD